MAEIDLAVMLVIAITAVAVAAVVVLGLALSAQGERQRLLVVGILKSNDQMAKALDQTLMHAMANSEDSRTVMAWYTDRKAAEATLEEIRRHKARTPSRVPPDPPEPKPDLAVQFGGEETDTTG